MRFGLVGTLREVKSNEGAAHLPEPGDLGSVPRLGTRLLFSPLPEKLSRHAGRMLARPPAQAALVKGTQDTHRTDAGS